MPQTSGRRTTIAAYIDPQGVGNAISTELVHHVTGLPKPTLDAWANPSNPLMVNASLVFPGQQGPIHTFHLCLTADPSPWIVFSRDLQREWDISSSYQHVTAQGASSDTYEVYAWVPHCATCGKEITRSKQCCTTVSRYCRAMAETSSGSQRVTSTWDSPSQVWDEFDPAQQRQWQRQHQATDSILETTRRIATEAFMDSGSTQQLQFAQQLSQRMLATRLRRVQGTP